MADLVSILIPAYNAEKWLAETIRSAIEQIYDKKEIIVVDDGSRDRTLYVARSFESKMVKVLSQENKGASAARNKALSIAQGDYIQWLDADDVLAPDKVFQQLKHAENIESQRILLSSAWGRFYYRKDKAKFIPNSLWQNLSPAEWIYRKLNDNAWMAIESWLVSRRLTGLAGPWDEHLSMDDDGEYFCRIVSASKGIVFVPNVKSFCRMGNLTSISSCSDLSDKKLESQFKSICSHIEYLLSLEDSERTRSTCIKYLQRWLIYFYPEKLKIIDEAKVIAARLGSELTIPTQTFRYELIRRMFGWGFSKKAQRMIPAGRVLLERTWDWLSHQFVSFY